MEDKNFDDIIKNKISDASFSGDSDWSEFSAKLDKANAEEVDEQLEKKIKNTLTEASEPYQAKHWEILKEKLQVEEYIRSRLYAIKGIEATIIILVYMLINTIYQPYELIVKRLQVPVLMAHEVNGDRGSFSENMDVLNVGFLKTDAVKTSRTGSLNQSDLFSASSESAKADQKPVVTAPINSLNRSNNHQGSNSREAYNAGQDQGSDAVLLPIVDIYSKTENTNQKVDYQEQKNQSTRSGEMPVIQPIASIALKPLQRLQDDEQESPAAITLVGERHNKGGWYVGPTMSFNGDVIDSPNDEVYPNLLKYTSYSQGLSLGIDATYRSGRFGLGTGLRYTRQSYSPREISETVGSVASGISTTTLEEIQYDVVTIPIQGSYKLLRDRKFTPYAGLELGVNVIAAAEYTAQEESSNRSVRSFNINRNTDLNKDLEYLPSKDFEKGLLEGGALLSNMHLTGTTRLGLLYQVSPGLVVDFSLAYRHHLFQADVGPNNDQIHTFVIGLGVQYRI